MLQESDANDDSWLTETVLQNVRVLAIDQVIEEKDGQKSKVGNTATLELTAQQVEIISAAQKLAGKRLTLALRSVEDAEIETTDAGSHLLTSGSRRKRGQRKNYSLRLLDRSEAETMTFHFPCIDHPLDINPKM